MVNYETETITVAKDGSTTSYTPAVKNYEHFESPEPQLVTFDTGSTYTVDYYYDRETHTLEITYETGTYADGTVTPGTGTYKGTARYGQTLTTVFSGMQDDYPTSLGGKYSLNYGYVLTGYFTDGSGNRTKTMPAPVEGEDTVTLTAEWEGDTFEINFNYVGRPDVLTALQEAGIDADWSDFGSATIRISLTYGEEALLPEITGLRGIGYNW